MRTARVTRLFADPGYLVAVVLCVSVFLVGRIESQQQQLPAQPPVASKSNWDKNADGTAWERKQTETVLKQTTDGSATTLDDKKVISDPAVKKARRKGSYMKQRCVAESYTTRLFDHKSDEKQFFGGGDDVLPWVKSARKMLAKNFEDVTPKTRLSDIYDPRAEVPLNGWGFKVPSAYADLTVEEWADSFMGAEADPIPEGDLAYHTRRANEEAFLDVSADPTPLPEEYNFFKEYPNCEPSFAWHQERCGACWAWSASGHLTHRLCKAMTDAGWQIPKDWRLSVQELVSCVNTSVSTPNNGCKSGKSNMAAFWLANRATVEESCLPYQSGDGGDRKNKCLEANKCTRRWGPFGSENVYYMHLLNGAEREQAIMRAIKKRGPVSATFKVAQSFMGYRGQGVYSRAEFDRDVPKTGAHPVHAVVIAGWGVHQGKKYWLVQNTWGAIYQVMGGSVFQQSMFRMLRGMNESGIESIAVNGIRPKIPAKNPFKSAEEVRGAVPSGDRERVLGVCQTEVGVGFCVKECKTGIILAGTMTKPCAADQKCCQIASTVPESPCASLISGATCTDEAACKAAGKVPHAGYCSGYLDKQVCCLPRIPEKVVDDLENRWNFLSNPLPDIIKYNNDLRARERDAMALEVSSQEGSAEQIDQQTTNPATNADTNTLNNNERVIRESSSSADQQMSAQSGNANTIDASTITNANTDTTAAPAKQDAEKPQAAAADVQQQGATQAALETDDDNSFAGADNSEHDATTIVFPEDDGWDSTAEGNNY